MGDRGLICGDFRFHRAATMFATTLSWIGYGCSEDLIFYRHNASIQEPRSILDGWPIDEFCSRQIEAYFANGMAESFNIEVLADEFLTKVLQPLTKHAAHASGVGSLGQELVLCRFTLKALNWLEECFGTATSLLLGSLAQNMRLAIEKTMVRITDEAYDAKRNSWIDPEILASEAIKKFALWSEAAPPLLSLVVMPPNVITTCCAFCHETGPRDTFAWMAHLDFCMDCMRTFVSEGWAVLKEGRQYICTPDGVRRFPGLKIISHCPRDGMPIYRRWIEGGIATEEACPYCEGREAQMSENRGLDA